MALSRVLKSSAVAVAATGVWLLAVLLLGAIDAGRWEDLILAAVVGLFVVPAVLAVAIPVVLHRLGVRPAWRVGVLGAVLAAAGYLVLVGSLDLDVAWWLLVAALVAVSYGLAALVTGRAAAPSPAGTGPSPRDRTSPPPPRG